MYISPLACGWLPSPPLGVFSHKSTAPPKVFGHLSPKLSLALGEGRMLSKEGAGWRAEQPRGFGNSALDHRTVFPERISQSYLSITRSAKMTGYYFHGINSKLRLALIGSHRTDFVLKGCFSETNYLCLREITQWKNSGPNFRGCVLLGGRHFIQALLPFVLNIWRMEQRKRVWTDDGVPALLKLTQMSLWKNNRHASGSKWRNHPERSS